MKNERKKLITVAVSGGFDPIHVGHIRLFQEAKKLGSILVVIINNDNWIRKKKGIVFMPAQDRKEIIKTFGCVDRVVLTRHKPNTKDMSICADLQRIRPDIFVNGGDRTKKNIPELAACKKMDCKVIFGVGSGGKVQSSSWLLAKYLQNKSHPCSGGKKHKKCCGE